MKNITLGKYMPLNSILHNLDPRSKIISLFFIIFAILFTNSFLIYGFLLAIAIFLVVISKIGIWYVLKSFKPMLFMIFILLLVNILTVKDGTLLIDFYIKVYSQAVINTFLIVIRLFLMVCFTSLLTSSTKPLDLTLGIEFLLKPLSKFNFPSHEIAMMLSIALRFIPDIIDDTNRIMNAQKSRGVDFEKGKFKEKIMGIITLIVPLFILSFQKAYDLADAMDVRGYVPGAIRTRYRELKYHFLDYVFIYTSLIIMILIIVERFFIHAL